LVDTGATSSWLLHRLTHALGLKVKVIEDARIPIKLGMDSHSKIEIHDQPYIFGVGLLKKFTIKQKMICSRKYLSQ